MEPEAGEAPQKAPKANLGDFQKLGWYILFMCVAQEFMTLSYLANITFMVYAGFSPTVVGCGSSVFSGSDLDRCEQLKAARNESACEVVLDTQFESVNYEFELLCEDSVLVKHSTSIQMVGVMIGSMVFGHMSDSFGRRKVLLVSIAGMFVFSIVSSFSSSLFTFNITRVILMFFNGGMSSVQLVYIMEMLPKNHRLWIFTLVTTSPNYIVLAGMAYSAGDWRVLSRYTSFFASLPAFVLVFCAHESPRWLVQKGRLDEAREVLVTVDRLNGTLTAGRLVEMDDILDKERTIFEAQRHRRRYSFMHLFYTWKLTAYITTLSFALFSASITSYALIFNMDKLSGSIYWNSVFYGVFRYAMNILTGLADYFGGRRTGRKVIHNVSLVYVLCALGTVFVSSFFRKSPLTCKKPKIGEISLNFCGDVATVTLAETQNEWMTRIATLTAAAMCSQLFLSAIVTTNELFPTAVRNLASSFTSFINRIGTVVAPHFFYMALFWAPLPYLILLFIGVVDLVAFSVVLPETKGTHMADHMPRPEERIFAKKRKTTAATGLLESQ
uniref:MFS domain-containing protein n=1 Tax=Steinernema glaseri TaxID=37863 RepID=A0A1I7XYN5_9BILA